MLRQLFDPGDWLGMKPALDPTASPLALHYAPAPGEGKLRIGVGAGVLAVVAVVVALLGEDGFLVFVASGFGFFGLLNLVYGVVQSGFEKSLLVTDSHVVVATRSRLRGRREWQEPLASYRGVRLREHHRDDDPDRGAAAAGPVRHALAPAVPAGARGRHPAPRRRRAGAGRHLHEPREPRRGRADPPRPPRDRG